MIDIARVGEAFVIACEAALAEKTQRAARALRGDGRRRRSSRSPAPRTRLGRRRSRVDARRSSRATAGDARRRPIRRVERLRIRAGFLRYGVDVDEDHFPFETPLAQFLDYKKGCYVGQEPVFRVHAQGNSARTLRGLVVEGDAPIAQGAIVKHATKDNAGEVTSSVAAGDGTTLALGYLHRTCGTSAAPSRSTAARRPCTSCRGECSRALAAPLLAAAARRLRLRHEQLRDERLLGRPVPDLRRPHERRASSSGCARTARSDAHRGARRAVADHAHRSAARRAPSRSTTPTSTLLGARGARRRPRLAARRVRRRSRSSTLHPCETDGLRDRPRRRRRARSSASSALDVVRRRRAAPAPRRRQIFVLPDIAGERAARSRVVRRGVALAVPRRRHARDRRHRARRSSNRRIALDTCLAPNPDPLAAAERARHRRAARAVDRASASRSSARRPTRATASSIPTAPDARRRCRRRACNLPSGPVDGRARRRCRASRSSATRASNPRAPCRQVYAQPPARRARLRAATTARARTATRSARCPRSSSSRRAAASTCSSSPTTNPTLQALRTELRPDQPEVDGILGTDALRDARARHRLPARPPARALHRSTTCGTRPALLRDADRTRVTAASATCPGRSRPDYSSRVVTPASTSAACRARRSCPSRSG